MKNIYDIDVKIDFLMKIIPTRRWDTKWYQRQLRELGRLRHIRILLELGITEENLKKQQERLFHRKKVCDSLLKKNNKQARKILKKELGYGNVLQQIRILKYILE